jgi:lipopolysaccharide export system protein LptA
MIRTLICLIFSPFLLFSQNSGNDKIDVDHADFMYLKTVEADKFQILVGHVAMHQDSLKLFCDSASIQNEVYVTAQSSVVIQQGESLTIFAQRLFYDATKKWAKLQGNVVFVNEGKTLFTEEMDYDVNSKIAYLESSTDLRTDSLSLRSNKGVYRVDDKTAIFKDSVFVENPDFKMLTDYLEYYLELELSQFEGPSIIQLDSGIIYAEGGFFDQQSGKAGFWTNVRYEKEQQMARADTIFYFQNDKRTRLLGNAMVTDDVGSILIGDLIQTNDLENHITIEGCSYVKDSTGILEASFIFYDKNEKWGKANENVFWQDSAAQYFIECDAAYYSDSSGFFKAIGTSEYRPLLINVENEDSLFLTSDTLLSYKDNESRHFIGYPNVKVFKTDLQMICDSLHYNESEAVFKLFINPMIWSDTSAFYGDTIFVFRNENDIEKIKMIENAFIVNSKDEFLFNQIKGKYMTSYFFEGKIDFVEVDGNAQSIYFVLDDDEAYIGVNRSVGSEMLIRFEDGEVQTIKINKEVESKFTPIQDADLEEFKLEGFKWLPSIRPTSVHEIRKIQTNQDASWKMD